MSSGEGATKGGVIVRPLGIVSGLVFGLGLAILLQQYGVTPFTTGSLVLWLVIGLAVGILLPTAMFHVAKRKGGA